MISNSGHDENNRYSGGKAGDQTATEWYLRSWYSRPWNCVLRYPDINVGNKLADLSIKAAQNDYVGYDQTNRNSYWYELVKVNYNPSNIKTYCEADCSAGVCSNVKAVGHLLNITALQNIPITSTYYMRTSLKNAGFQVLTDTKYLTSDKYLLPGDILLNDNAHTAVNVSTGELAASTQTTTTKTTTSATAKVKSADYFDKTLAGTYSVTASTLYVRAGGDKSKYAPITAIVKGTRVQCYGYYDLDSSHQPWLYIQVTVNGITYTGFSSKQYLAKM